MNNILKSLSDSGALIIAPVVDKGKKHLFHNREWSLDDLIVFLTNYKILVSKPFRSATALLIKHK